MKKHINLFKKLLLATLVIQPMLIWAATNEDGAEKRKTISKSYSVGSNDKLNIANSFGDVTIKTWDKNEFKVDIDISVKAATDEKAQQLIDQIEVEDSKSENMISFKTITKFNNFTFKKTDSIRTKNFTLKEGEKYSINYVVSMPSANALYIKNQFGKTIVPDMSGPVNLVSEYGSLVTGNLGNVESIDVQFGKAQIGDVHNGKIVLKFDNKSTVGKLSGSVKIVNEFSDLVQYYISNAIEELTISESYSSIRLIVPKDLSAHFEIHTNFGDFKNNTDFTFTDKATNSDDDMGIHFDKDYTGTVGDGKAKIKIKSSFGDIKLSHTALSKEEEEAAPQQKNNKKRKKEVEVS